MSSTSFTSAEASPDKDGLIHGVSAEELQVIGEQCIEAKAKAYCESQPTTRSAQDSACHSKNCMLKQTNLGPYSLFRVGASLLLNSTIPSPSSTPTYPASHIITGANVENAAYPVGTCAERVAMGTAVHMGHRIGSFKAVGVSTDIADFCSPCGMCRQYLREFLALETPVFMFNKEGKFIVRTMGELLPLSFGPDVLPPREEMRRVQEEDKAKTA
jgi:cytidine deaminase